MSRSPEIAPPGGEGNRVSDPQALAEPADTPISEVTSVSVSTGMIRAGRDIVIAGQANREGSPRSRRLAYRSVIALLAGISLLVYLTVRFWPVAKEVPVDLELETSYLRFRLAEKQPVLGRLPVATLSAHDLEEIDLPGSGVDGDPVRKDEGTRRLGLRLEARNEAGAMGTLTLQEAFLPAGAVVEMKAVEGGEKRFSIDSMEEPFSLSLHGGYRFRLLRSGRKPPPWTAAIASTPEHLELLPRSGRLELLVGSQLPPDEQLAPSIRIDRLWLYEIERTYDGEETRLAEIYHIRAGKVGLGSSGEALELGRGSELRIEAATGALSALRWSDEGIRFRFQGTTTSLSRGPRGQATDLLPQRSATRAAITDLAAGLAILNGVLSLLLSAPALHRRFRARSDARHFSSTPNP